jgi:AP-3 complex subunit sigma
VPEFGDTTKIIYRHYATLHFIFVVDQQESDLGILDLIQVFVEALDQCFEGVCELDLIFHSDKVHFIIDEIIMGGMVLETNLTSILTAINDQTKLHAATPSSMSSMTPADMATGVLGMNPVGSTAGKLLQSLYP